MGPSSRPSSHVSLLRSEDSFDCQELVAGALKSLRGSPAPFRQQDTASVGPPEAQEVVEEVSRLLRASLAEEEGGTPQSRLTVEDVKDLEGDVVAKALQQA